MTARKKAFYSLWRKALQIDTFGKIYDRLCALIDRLLFPLVQLPGKSPSVFAIEFLLLLTIGRPGHLPFFPEFPFGQENPNGAFFGDCSWKLRYLVSESEGH